MKNTFPKSEKLKSKKYFDQLFSHGESIKSFPILVIYMEWNKMNLDENTIFPLTSQAGFSVPKKRFKKAVDRNRIKRQMREAYRLNKSILNKKYALLFVYLPREHTDYRVIEKSMIQLLSQLK